MIFTFLVIVFVKDLFMKSALDSIFEVSLGTELGSLESKTSQAKEFQKALDVSVELLFHRYFDPLWKLKRFFNVGSAKAMKNNISIVNDYVYKLIQSKNNQISKNTVSFEEGFGRCTSECELHEIYKKYKVNRLVLSMMQGFFIYFYEC